MNPEAKPRRFEFARNFDEATVHESFDRDARDAIAYARGFTDGQNAERGAEGAKALRALEELAVRLEGVAEDLTSWRAEIEKNFASLALAFAQKLSCDLLERFPTEPARAMLRDLAREGLREIRLIVKTSPQTEPALGDELRRLVEERLPNQSVRLEVDESLARHDLSVSWEKGGFIFDQSALEGRLRQIITEAFPQKEEKE